MMHTTKIFCLAAIFATFATPSLAQVAGFNDAGSYNSGYGMNAGSAQQPVNVSLRDGNGNLSVVNGQFTTSTMAHSTGVQKNYDAANDRLIGVYDQVVVKQTFDVVFVRDKS